jgi:hypothetical protein
MVETVTAFEWDFDAGLPFWTESDFALKAVLLSSIAGNAIGIKLARLA